MKYTLTSLIAYLSANEVNAQWGYDAFYSGYWDYYYYYEIKWAKCHYYEDYYDWYKPRFMVELSQIGPDNDPE